MLKIRIIKNCGLRQKDTKICIDTNFREYFVAPFQTTKKNIFSLSKMPSIDSKTCLKDHLYRKTTCLQ